MLLYNKLLPNLKYNIPIVHKPLYNYNQNITSSVHVRKLKRELNYFNALKSRYELDWITEEEKVYCLKYLFIGFYYFYQVKDFNFEIVNNCRNYIKQVLGYMFAKAKNF